MPTEKLRVMFHGLGTSTIHGVPDLVLSRVWASRLIWAGLLCGGLVMFIVQSHKVMDEFMQHPIATRVANFVPSRVPSVTYCPSGWTTHERLKEAGVGRSLAMVLLAVFPLDPYDVRHRLRTINLTETYTSFRKLVDETKPGNDSWEKRDLGVLFGSPPEDMFEPDEDYVTSISTDTLAACYDANFTNAQTAVEMSLSRFLLKTKFATFPFGLDRGYDSLYIGTGTFTSDEVRLAPKVDYMVYISMSKSRRLEDAECRDWSSTERVACIEQCANQILDPLIMCQQERFEELKKLLPGALHLMNCDMYAYFTIELDLEVYGYCFKKCPTFCETMTYQFSLASKTVSSMSPNATSRLLEFSLVNVFDSLFISEYPSYTMWTLVSNLGGTLSLWFGASFISIFQLIFLCAKLKRASAASVSFVGNRKDLLQKSPV